MGCLGLSELHTNCRFSLIWGFCIRPYLDCSAEFSAVFLIEREIKWIFRAEYSWGLSGLTIALGVQFIMSCLMWLKLRMNAITYTIVNVAVWIGMRIRSCNHWWSLGMLEKSILYCSSSGIIVRIILYLLIYWWLWIFH